MPTYLALLNFTAQGAQAFRDTRKRADAFKDQASAAGVTVKQLYWTLGPYDGAVVLEAPDDQSVTAVMLALAAAGNVRTQTLRAFDADEMDAVLAKAAGGRGGGSRAGRK